MMRIFTLLALLAGLLSTVPAHAQTAVNTDCTTFVTLYPAASRGKPVSIDQFGATCIKGTVTATVDTSLLATAANQVLQITQETAINTLLGLQADSACGTDNGTCTLAALVKRLNQRLTTLNTTLGSPFQAGGSIGNTIFGATLPATPLVASGNGVVLTPTSEAAVGVAPVVSSALESNHVICAAACNFYGGYITTGATAGWLLLANATSAPTAAGAAIAPIACVLAPANQTTSIGGAGAPIRASTGIVMVFSTSGCLTNTASTTAYLSGQAK